MRPHKKADGMSNTRRQYTLGLQSQSLKMPPPHGGQSVRARNRQRSSGFKRPTRYSRARSWSVDGQGQAGSDRDAVAWPRSGWMERRRVYGDRCRWNLAPGCSACGLQRTTPAQPDCNPEAIGLNSLRELQPARAGRPGCLPGNPGRLHRHVLLEVPRLVRNALRPRPLRVPGQVR